MSSSNVKPITIRVLNSEGRDLGTARVRPTGGNWRLLQGKPSVRIGDRTVPCERRGDDWILQLKAGETKPRNRG